MEENGLGRKRRSSTDAHPPQKSQRKEVAGAPVGQAEIESIRARRRRRAAGVADEFDTNADAGVLAEEADPLPPDPSEGPFEPFNLTQEKREGRFDESGGYSWGRGEEKVLDGWLAAVDEDDEAKKAEDETQTTAVMTVARRRIAERETFFAGQAAASVDVRAALNALVPLLRTDDDTPLALMNRLKTGEQVEPEATPEEPFNALNACKKHKKQQPSATNKSRLSRPKPMSPENRLAFEKVTELCDQLTAEGINVYRESKCDISRRLEQHRGGADDGDFYWQYRVAAAAMDGGPGGSEPQIFGPFASQTMAEWRSQGFLPEGLDVRQVTSTNEPTDGLWRQISAVSFLTGAQQQQLDQMERDAEEGG